MDSSPAVAAAPETTPTLDTGPVVVDAQAPPGEQSITILKSWIRCRPGRPKNYCSGTGSVTAIVNGQRVKRLCACVDESIRAAKAAREAAAAEVAHIAELVATAADLQAPPAEAERRHIPAGAREKMATLKRELGRETARLATIREEIGAAIAGVSEELAALTAEEAQNRRDTAAAEGTKRVAGAHLEELRARLAGLRAQLEEADAALELLGNQAGQFGARRMQAEAKLKAAKGGRVVDEKRSADRVESLEYRLRQHLARWPELAEATAS